MILGCHRFGLLSIVIFGVLFNSQCLQAADINEKRAKFNYQMFCQGCHTPDGVGGKSVPKLKGFMGHFLKTQKGREYLVRVPGAANAPLDDNLLAEVLNWKLLQFSEGSLPLKWTPYTGEEVAEYRKDPLLEVVEYRRLLVKDIMGDDH